VLITLTDWPSATRAALPARAGMVMMSLAIESLLPQLSAPLGAGS
jgi:hypothetical protein